ncbi:bifunctional 3-(3-hydroxy-phenyl)propionate/3-hydroxycinnamic acid hydroxylase [Rhizobium sp. FKY42]|uniref:bifunctional 3-(3-hydroxy-phenyl)propionate/3-hydroxycinnamic acid hydroxylase n=1 Tax=Rhizobium sp. FKY42 TaxID=2562310 RepID=UPI0010C00577|nr:bifunctional 3-(3-hydroxy-phenyl)propionate/3-hydroxycinnamic acid hydroxylase [Rhizobium sp. FKY42]
MQGRGSRSDQPFDVAIVGLGPVGTTLAALLAGRGLHVLALDAAADLFNLPRAIGLDQEVMRVFQELGLGAAVSGVTSAYRPTEYRTADGEVIRRFLSQEPPYPLAWPPYLTFLQPDLERVLREHLTRCSTVDMRLATELTDLREIETMPVLTLLDKRSGEVRNELARFVVGCDGGNSFVRRHLGIGFEDLVFDEPWVVVDMLVEQDVSLPEVNVQYCDPARPHTFVVGPRNLRRWEFMLLPGEDPAAMSGEDTVWGLLSPWLKRGEARLWRAAAYRFHALVAKQWGRGRVFLAGDACHMTPPFLAQGMVQGIKDAANLGWKLASVLDGAPESLLATYEAERRPLVKEVISITKGLGAIIGERDPALAEERNRRMRADMASGGGTTIRQDLFPPIGPGPLCLHGIGSVNAAGRPSPQPEIIATDGSVRCLDDILGYGFHLLVRQGFEPAPTDRHRLETLAITPHVIAEEGEKGTLCERHAVFRLWMQKHACEAILVRPDHVVLAGLRTPGDLTHVLDAILPVLAAT